MKFFISVIIIFIVSIIFYNYIFSQIVELSPRSCWLNTKQSVMRKAKIEVEKLILNAEKEGMCLVVTSGYRSEDEQQKIIEKYGELAKKEGSEHLTGLAVDFTACPMKNGKRDDSVERPELAKEFKELPEYRWLIENASNYGFVQSYREDNQEETDVSPEEWHWRFTK